MTTAFKSDFRKPHNEHTEVLDKQKTVKETERVRRKDEVHEERRIEKAFKSYQNELIKSKSEALDTEQLSKLKKEFIDQL